MRFMTSIDRIGEDIGNSFAALFAHIGRCGAHPAGPPLALYFDEEFNPGQIDMAVCIPVTGQVAGGEGIEPTMLAGGLFASTMHRGPYDTIRESYDRLVSWMENSDYSPAGPDREVYLTDPCQTSDPSELLTEILWPVNRA